MKVFIIFLLFIPVKLKAEMEPIIPYSKLFPEFIIDTNIFGVDELDSTISAVNKVYASSRNQAMIREGLYNDILVFKNRLLISCYFKTRLYSESKNIYITKFKYSKSNFPIEITSNSGVHIEIRRDSLNRIVEMEIDLQGKQVKSIIITYDNQGIICEKYKMNEITNEYKHNYENRGDTLIEKVMVYDYLSKEKMFYKGKLISYNVKDTKSKIEYSFYRVGDSFVHLYSTATEKLKYIEHSKMNTNGQLMEIIKSDFENKQIFYSKSYLYLNDILCFEVENSRCELYINRIKYFKFKESKILDLF